MGSFAAVIERDLKLALRHGMDNIVVLAFFVIAVVLFPFGVGPEPDILARAAPGVIWVAALLAVLLSLERLFQIDYEDGSLELIILGAPSIILTVLAKITAHWLTTGLPLILVTPLLGVMMNLDGAGYGLLIAALALGTPSLSLIGSVGAALVLGARRGGVLTALLVLPLYIPVLIFGAGAVDAALGGLDAKPHLMLLGAVFAAALALCPLAAAAALRQSAA